MIYNCDCLEGLKTISDASVDLIVTDPPYYRVMVEEWNGKKHDWDKQWETIDEYLAWFGQILDEFNRVMKPSGSLYIYCDNIKGAYNQVEVAKRFSIINVITWIKNNGMNSKYWRNIRQYAGCTERIIFAEKMGASGLPKTGWQEVLGNCDCFREIKDYLISERDRLMADKGMDMTAFRKYFSELTGTDRMEYHYFHGYQWTLPTKEIFEKMQTSGYWCRDYEELRRDYEELRRDFAPSKNYTDAWESNITTSTEETIHPTQKPLSHVMRMIEVSSKPGDMVLDPFMGGGTTAEACIRTGRQYIGFETSKEYYEASLKRISSAAIAESGRTRITDWVTLS